MPNQYPKMIYRRGQHTIIHTAAELASHQEQGWSTDPAAPAAYTMAEAREKLAYFMAGFEKWNDIVKEIEGEQAEEEPKRKCGRPRKDQA